MSFRLSLLAVIPPLQPVPGFMTGASFSGGLERVGNTSISLRLADRRVIDAILPDTPLLAATAIVARYGLGDQVEVTCRPIQPVWEESTSRYQSLEVSTMRLIHRPSPKELAQILEGTPFQEGKNLLNRPEAALPRQTTDVNSPGGPELEHARGVNLEYAANMPNFVADEKANRYRSSPGSLAWRDFDTVESEITFRGNHAARLRIRRNGVDWQAPFEALPGFKWYEGFGTEISPLFDPKCPTTLDYHGSLKSSGRILKEYRFSTPVDGCFPFFFFGYQRYNPARTGHVFIDEATGSIRELDEDARGFPEEIEFAEREEHISWDYVKIGEVPHLLPVSAQFSVRYYDGTRYRIVVEYRNHRHFEASTSVTFQ